jgi:hypothetical protein
MWEVVLSGWFGGLVVNESLIADELKDGTSLFEREG